MSTQNTRQITMTIKRNVRRALRYASLDVVRWRAQSSTEAALLRMFDVHRIDTVLDVGANEGQYACWLRGLGFLGRVISFEPLCHGSSAPATSSKQRPSLDNRSTDGRWKRRRPDSMQRGLQPRCVEFHPAYAESSPGSSPKGHICEFLESTQNIFLKVDTQGF